MKAIVAHIITGLSLVPKPATFGRDSTPRTYKAIRGNPFSKIYHRHGCEYGDKMSHTRAFASPIEALAHGYRACSVCRPNSDER
jgi:hypothetical protein